MIVVIDNYDSFTWNLVQFLGALGQEIAVFRNDQVTLDELEKLQPERLVISPGPGWPRDAGITLAVIRHFAPKLPILGVCLGHQTIGEAFGAKISLAPEMMHGKASMVFHSETELFRNLANPFEAGRYHSLIVDRENLPVELAVTAQTEDEIIMGIQHKTYPTVGVQFHPESILTGDGMRLLENFLII